MCENLIVYFSHNQENYVSGKIVNLEVGNTKVVSEKLKKLINADVFEIVPLHAYPSKYQACTAQAKQELQKNARPKITDYVSNIHQYKNIYIGYPNWWSTMPMCVWTFLQQHDLTNKNIYPFCTHEGSGMGNSIQDMQKLCPNSIIHMPLAIKGSDVQKCDAQLERWVKENGNK